MPLPAAFLASALAASPPAPLHAPVSAKVVEWFDRGRPPTLTEERAADLAPLADWIADKKARGETAHLLFVCTHNSRRSQMGQAWAQAAALQLGLDHVKTWSGGTEATAFNPRAVKALQSHGFVIEPTSELRGEDNPEYRLGYGPSVSQLAFSKVYGDAFNPRTGFAAVLVCSSADASCPYVEGAELRVAVPYLDPKASDGSPEEAATYLAKSEEVGWEWAWLMGQAHRVATPQPQP